MIKRIFIMMMMMNIWVEGARGEQQREFIIIVIIDILFITLTCNLPGMV